MDDKIIAHTDGKLQENLHLTKQIQWNNIKFMKTG